MTENAKQYGESYQEHLLEQYKLYVQMADNVSARRDRANGFYTTLLGGLFAVLSVIAGVVGEGSPLCYLILCFAASAGTLLSLVWMRNIQSYRQLNSGKFRVIHEMEKDLPFACFDEEWTFLGRGKDPAKYLQLTRVEKKIPVILSVLYGCFALVTLLAASWSFLRMICDWLDILI